MGYDDSSASKKCLRGNAKGQCQEHTTGDLTRLGRRRMLKIRACCFSNWLVISAASFRCTKSVNPELCTSLGEQNRRCTQIMNILAISCQRSEDADCRKEARPHDASGGSSGGNASFLEQRRAHILAHISAHDICFIEAATGMDVGLVITLAQDLKTTHRRGGLVQGCESQCCGWWGFR